MSIRVFTIRTFLVPVFVFFASCVSNPTPIDLTAPPPSIPVDDPDGKAEIVIFRQGIMAYAVTFGVYVNDLHVGELHTNDFIHTRVEPGMVKMFAGAEARSQARFPVEADRAYYLRALPKAGWWFARVQLEVVEDPAEAKAKLEKFADKTFETPKPFPFELDLPAAGPPSP